MSQAAKHITWCLGKAAKEIEECKKWGKRPKHRGLVEGKPDLKEAQKHLDKARHNLEATLLLQKGKFADISAGTLFYSMYHCFLAIASRFGYESRNQTCTVALVELLVEEGKIDLDKGFIEMLRYSEQEGESSVIDMREEYMYGAALSVKDEKKMDEMVNSCKDLIFKTNRIVFGK